MATKTSLLGLTKPAYTEAADIAVLNTNFDLIDKAVGNGARSANLLRNSNFADPINTSGENTTTKNWQYFMDGWILAATDTSPVYFDINKQYRSTGFSTATEADIYLIQRFPLGVLKQNTTYTFAYERWGVIHVGYVSGFEETDIFTQFVMQVSSGSYLKWVALYEGTYTAENLPAYVVPDKRIEMIRCGVPMNPPNLLVNSWFVNPVNSQGAASYKGESNKNTYTIDRWFFSYDSAAELTVGSGYIQKNEHKFWQRPKGIDTSKMYTGAICLTSGTVYVYSGTFSDGFGSWDKTLWCGVTSGHAYFRIETGMTEPVKWAALYEGAYDAETLPEYVVPDKRAEMIRCDVPLNPPNLLDNSYFRAGSAIAQAGVNGTHGSTKYPLDRWISWDKDITQSTNYITTGSPIDQYIESSKIDSSAVYTAAVGFADGTTQIISGNFTTGFGSKATGCLYCATASSGKPYVRMQTGFNICWVALYEGKYDADTLPEYHYKGYAAELAECQRYYENSWFGGTVASATRQFMGINISATQGDCYVQFMTPKAEVATITFYKASSTSAASVWETYRSHYYEVTVESLGRDGRNGFVIRFTKTDTDPTAWAAREAVPLRGHWEASADL